MGPVTLAPRRGIDVPPHPHIGLATVTYLLDGELIHRDSLGSHQAIQPGEINWMTAGRGVVHSERTGPELRRAGSNLHALQLWVALPKAHEEGDPAFRHYAAQDEGQIRVLIGRGYGVESQVRTLTPTFLIDMMVQPGRELPIPGEYEERAAYVVAGAVHFGSERAEAGRMLVFAPRVTASVRAESPARIILLGGDPIDGPRHIWWNFVSSSQERIEQAKRDWKERRFPAIPGDDKEFTPLPTYS
jgi:redox-sensitive bicupin YhaK (pirin superfamily)